MALQIKPLQKMIISYFSSLESMPLMNLRKSLNLWLLKMEGSKSFCFFNCFIGCYS